MSLPPPTTTPKIGLGSPVQRKITRLIGPAQDEEAPEGLPPAA